VPWWVEDLTISERYGWPLEYVTDLAPWWRMRIRLWAEAQAEQSETQNRKARSGK
jgi:hypothetical protein